MQATQKDFEIFFNHIKSGSKVIDIGCGEGDFLLKLKQEKNCVTFGIDVDSTNVLKCINKGLSVIQGDADADLNYYPNKENTNNSFDYAILANTIQAIKDPKTVLEQAKRIAKQVLISTPNFGYIETRLFFAIKGIMPVTKQLPYEWYNTPNIHFSTIKDMSVLLTKLNFTIDKFYYIDSKNNINQGNIKNMLLPNLFGKTGVYLVS
jgi:methionine biosynthesis protein MetW